MSLIIRSKSSRKPGLNRTLACTALVLALFLSACGGGSPDRSGNLTSADEVLAAAREAFSLVTSYRSETHIVTKQQTGEGVTSSGTMTLAWSAPDRIHVTTEGSEEGEEAQRSEFIFADGRVMVRHSTSGNIWADFPADPNADDGAPRGILALMEMYSDASRFLPDMDEAELVGKTVIDGLSVYHIKGRSNVRLLPPEDWPADVEDDTPTQQNDSNYDLYIGVNDLLPRKLVVVTDITYKASRLEGSGVERLSVVSTVDLLDLNAPVIIELPEVR